MSMHREYKGFEIHAHGIPTPKGRYLPQTAWTRHNKEDTKELKHDPPCDPDGFDTEDAAIDCAMIFGLDVVDGHVPGMDLSKLL